MARLEPPSAHSCVELVDSGEETEDEELPFSRFEQSIPNAAAVERSASADVALSQVECDFALLDSVLSVRPFGRQEDKLSRWQEVLKRYVDITSLQASVRGIKKRVHHLHTVYLDNRTREHAQLDTDLREQLAKYHRFNPGNLAPIESLAEPAPKRRRINSRSAPPPTLRTLDLKNDVRMLRKYLDGAFTMYHPQGWPYLLPSIAEFRGDGWTGRDVKEQLEWLGRAYRNHSPVLHGTSDSHAQLLEMLKDYTTTLPLILGALQEMNASVKTSDCKTVDDLLLKEVRDCKPFSTLIEERVHDLWGKIALRLNKWIGANVVFTGVSCAERFHFLRQLRLTGGERDGERDGVRITRQQDEALVHNMDSISKL